MMAGMALRIATCMKTRALYTIVEFSPSAEVFKNSDAKGGESS